MHELRKNHPKSLFQDLGDPLASETTCRAKVGKFAEEEALQLQEYSKNQEMFMVVDDSDIDGTQFLNILVGKLTVHEKAYVCNLRIFVG